MHVLDRYFMRAYEYRRLHDRDPPVIPVTPEEYGEIQSHLRTWGVDQEATVDTLYGSKLAVVSFSDQPKFKRLQVMARLLGAEINYPVYKGGGTIVAEVFKDGAGARYYPPPLDMTVAITAPWPAPPLGMEDVEMDALSNGERSEPCSSP